MPFTTNFIVTSLLATLAVSAPAVSEIENRQSGFIPPCREDVKYINLKQTQPYYLHPELVSGYRCTSLKDSGCSLGSSATHSVGVTKTVSSGISGGLDLGKIWSAGVDAGFAYSGSTSDAKSVTENNECPPGGMTCGLQVEAQMVMITGTKRTEWAPSGCASAKEGEFTVIAPVNTGGGSKDQTAVQNFKICLAQECGDDACKAAIKKEGIVKCPS